MILFYHHIRHHICHQNLLSVDWMDKASKQEVEFEQLVEIVDASGNQIILKKKKKLNAKEKKKLIANIKKKIADGEDLDSDEEDYSIEFNL